VTTLASQTDVVSPHSSTCGCVPVFSSALFGRPVCCASSKQSVTTPPAGAARTHDAAGKHLASFSGCGDDGRKRDELRPANVVKIDPKISALIAPRSCAARDDRRSVAVFNNRTRPSPGTECGCLCIARVGLNVVASAAIACAGRIIAIDALPSSSRWAKRSVPPFALSCARRSHAPP
jgi:Zn-dependent alcohol dehydrogenase